MKRFALVLSVILLLAMAVPAVSAQGASFAGTVQTAPPQVRLSNGAMPDVELMELEEALQTLCLALEARQPSVAIKIAATNPDYQIVYETLLGASMAHTGVPTQGDYLLWQYAGSQGTVWTEGRTDGYIYTILYELSYYTTAQQEAQLDAAVEQLLTSLELEGLTDYQKLRKIYDYMCANITYDHDGLAAQDPLVYTAYGALINGKAVCQGYANLFYRLCLEAGIDCRIISGISYGDGHAWNIVKLGQKYYNMDTTWDAGTTSYRYFLRGDGDFVNHTRDELYDTADFHAVYPMDAEDYKPISGDTNGDGKVDAQDVEYLLMHVLYAEDFPLDVSGDYTVDGETTAQDVEYLLMHVLYAEDFPLPDGSVLPTPDPEDTPSIEAPLPDGEEGQP